MTKIYYYTELKNMTNTEITRFEKINRKNADRATREAENYSRTAEKFHMELNYRVIPQAPEMKRDIGTIRSELKRPDLSKTHKMKLEQALKASEAALLAMLKYGDSYRKPVGGEQGRELG